MISVAIVKELLAAGLVGDTLVAALERIESADSLRAEHVDQQAERRRAKDRERARVRRQSADSADTGSPDKEIPPTPPKEINPSPELRSVSVSARDPVRSEDRARHDAMAADFYVFWQGWPHKVGKPAALKAFLLARRTFSLEAIIAGRERYIAAKPPDRPWLNPATFLNQERFNDEPAAHPVPAAKERPHDPLFRALAEIAENGTGLGGWKASDYGAPAVTRVADSPDRNPYLRPHSAPKPRAHVALALVRTVGGNSEADGGVPDAEPSGFAGSSEGAGILRGAG